MSDYRDVQGVFVAPHHRELLDRPRPHLPKRAHIHIARVIQKSRSLKYEKLTQF